MSTYLRESAIDTYWTVVVLVILWAVGFFALPGKKIWEEQVATFLVTWKSNPNVIAYSPESPAPPGMPKLF
jgi:hypothetical protein